jgi:hypothetical protein
MAPGATWHWDFVHNDTAPDAPSAFTLSAGDHELCFAYREDDTRLDVLVVTSDTTFDPRAPIVGAPAEPRVVRVFNGKLALQVTWMTVLGATSYDLERSTDGGETWVSLATGLTGHTFTDTSTEETFVGHRYRVISHGPTGVTTGGEYCCVFFGNGEGGFSNDTTMSITAPLRQDIETEIGTVTGVTQGSDSLDVPPANGHARFDFKIATPGKFKAHAQVVVPNKGSDSFWVRVDQGAWVKWNNIVPKPPCSWDNVRNSDAGGTPMVWTLGAGSHSFEMAYREVGTGFMRVLIDNNLDPEEGYGLCFD